MIEEQNFADDFLTFLASTKENEVEKLFTFAIDSLIFADKVHTYHFKCDSGFQHTHFETIYENIRDFADALVETVLSMGVKFKAETGDVIDLTDALGMNNSQTGSPVTITVNRADSEAAENTLRGFYWTSDYRLVSNGYIVKQISEDGDDTALIDEIKTKAGIVNDLSDITQTVSKY